MYLFIFNIYTFNVKVLYKNILKVLNNYRTMCDFVNFFYQLTALIYILFYNPNTGYKKL